MTKNEKQPQPQLAEFDDDDDIEFGLDDSYDDNFVVKNADPNFHYYLAAVDSSGNRPDSAKAIERLGYEKCVKESASCGSDLVLMRVPQKKFAKRKAAQRRRRMAAKAAQARPRGIPSDSLVHYDEGDHPRDDE